MRPFLARLKTPIEQKKAALRPPVSEAAYLAGVVVEVMPPLPLLLGPDIELFGSYVEAELGPMLVPGFGPVGDVTTLPCGGVLGPTF